MSRNALVVVLSLFIAACVGHEPKTSNPAPITFDFDPRIYGFWNTKLEAKTDSGAAVDPRVLHTLSGKLIIDVNHQDKNAVEGVCANGSGNIVVTKAEKGLAVFGNTQTECTVTEDCGKIRVVIDEIDVQVPDNGAEFAVINMNATDGEACGVHPGRIKASGFISK